METIGLGLIGLGARGLSLARDLLLQMDGVRLTAVADDYGTRAADAAALVAEKTGRAPFATQDYRALLARPEVEAVLVVTPWECHVPMAIDALRARKPVGIEVCGASTLQQCFDLVRAQEETGTPFMFLENCCYGRTELAVTRMVREGLFGEIVHCAGAYAHDLRAEVAGGEENHHYRLRHYQNRNCENYPTHELGPIARLLDVNRGNRMLSLTATASKAAGMREYLRTHPTRGATAETRFAQGDVVTTCIRCANGETIVLTLDTTLPRYYCRDFTVRGTKGFYEERTDSVFLDGDDDLGWNAHWGNFPEYRARYEHPLWQRADADGVLGGHGGMDGLVYSAFMRCLQQGLKMPIDVYDAASWMSITPLSEASIQLGGAPQAIPDFTAGRWLQARAAGSGEWTLP